MRVLVTGGAGSSAPTSCTRRVAERPDVEVTVLDSFTYAGERGQPGAGARPHRVRPRATSRTPRWSTSWSRGTTSVVHFAAESHNDNSLRDPSPFVQTNLVGTYVCSRRCAGTACGCTTSPPTRCTATSSSTTRRSSPRHAVQPVQPVQRDQGRRRTCWCAPGCARSASRRRSRTARTTTARTSTSRSSSRARSPTCSPDCGPKLYGAGKNVRDWIHVDDHNSAVWTIIERGRLGRDVPHRRRRRA